MSERVTCPKCGNDLGGLFVLSDNPRVLDENPLFSEWLRAAVAAERERTLELLAVCKELRACDTRYEDGNVVLVTNSDKLSRFAAAIRRIE